MKESGMLIVTIEGRPQQQGSKISNGQGRGMRESNKNLRPWREKVEYRIYQAQEEVGGCPFNKTDPIKVVVQFRFEVPKSKDKKKGYPRYMTTAPDLDKLQRAIGDSFQSATGVNDSQIVQWDSEKIYVKNHLEEGVTIVFMQFEQEYVTGE